jgi:hypothetical protein
MVFIEIRNELKTKIKYGVDIIMSPDEKLHEYSVEDLLFKSVKALDDASAYHDSDSANPYLLKSIACSNLVIIKYLADVNGKVSCLEDMNDKLAMIKYCVNNR